MQLPPEFVEEVKNRNNIVDVISGYVSLRRAGSNYVACCPFHNEKTPSFTVFERSDSFYCFGCGAGGDVITFVMKAENTDYISAIEVLAGRAGLTVPDAGNDNGMMSKKRKTLDINKEAAKYFHSCLVSGKYPPAEAYIEKRGLQRAVRRFGLGFDPPGGKMLFNYLIGLGFTQKELNEAFVCNRGGYDIFENRVIFPIIDAQGNVIAFGGRAMGDEKPKYLNSNDTPAFNKRKNLFALNYAKNTKEDYFILCEGYTDVTALHLAGFSTAVASLGTSFTPEQASLMSKYKQKVVICYDGDAAGQNATQKAITLTEAAGIETKVLTVPEGLDPDEFIKKYGKERFAMLLRDSYGQVEFRCQNILSGFDLSAADQRVSAAGKIGDLISALPSQVERDVYTAKYAKQLDVPYESFRADIAKKRDKYLKALHNDEKKRLIRASEGYGDRVNPDLVRMKKAAYAEQAILGIAQISPEFIAKAEGEGHLSEDDFQTSFNKKVYLLIKKCIEENMRYDVALISEGLSTEEVGRITKMRISRDMLNDNSYEVFLQYADALRIEGRKKTASGDAVTIDDIQSIINNKKK